MEEEEARRRFTGARVARLGTVDPGGRPHLVPVVFAHHDDDRIVMAVDWKPKSSQRLKRLHNIAVHPAVCLLVDSYDEDWDRLWWARADGGARTIPPDASADQDRIDYEAAIALLRRKYPQYRDNPPEGAVIVVTVRQWSGWRSAAEPERAGQEERAVPRRHDDPGGSHEQADT
ncbi:TIGR03668 family PPOX class F420-dependent oxidoreductase [Streptomyces sp. TP-A0356]|uniref:TIGR03668 family PPOX class F420-dependent oxidoreductase n=1 Tax=Streptomyces sp. TP-A0356 TaxID=1359208 RepID=UPI0007C8000D